ncbi:MAG: hypothetical protein VKI83_02025 [Synechococcaceae cyanobacterium]|nr:hypothetical protein [Synechococcaceae cyanobacterium]
MAAPIAYEQPSLNRAWEAFVAHLAPMLLIWLITLAIGALSYGAYAIVTLLGTGLSGGGSASDTATLVASGLGNLAQLPFSIVSSFISVLFVAIPAMHYETGEVITLQQAFRTLFQRPGRYLLAGLLYTVACTLGFLLCILPGIAVLLVTPVYVNLIFNSDRPITDAFAASFQAVYRSERGLTFVGIEILVGLLVVLVSICTCLIGGLVAVPVATFYIQNAAYRQGVLS